MTAIGAAKLGIWKEPAVNQFGRVGAGPQLEPEQRKRINVAFVVDTKGKSLEEVGMFPVMTTEEIAQKGPESEPEPPPVELFDGNIGKLGMFVGDVPLSRED